MDNKYIVIVIVLLVLAGVGYYFMSVQVPKTEDGVTQSSTSTVTQSNTGTTPDQSIAQRDNAVILAENTTGNFAVIATAKLAKPGYVVVYRVNNNSETEVLAHSDLLSVGTYSNFSIQLGKIATKEQTLVAVLHEDDGDGRFEFPESDFYLGSAAARVVMDTDSVDVLPEDEAPILRDKVELYLKNTLGTTSASTSISL